MTAGDGQTADGWTVGYDDLVAMRSRDDIAEVVGAVPRT
jgi:hypothetical protein